MYIKEKIENIIKEFSKSQKIYRTYVSSDTHTGEQEVHFNLEDGKHALSILELENEYETGCLDELEYELQEENQIYNKLNDEFDFEDEEYEYEYDETEIKESILNLIKYDSDYYTIIDIETIDTLDFPEEETGDFKQSKLDDLKGEVYTSTIESFEDEYKDYIHHSEHAGYGGGTYYAILLLNNSNELVSNENGVLFGIKESRYNINEDGTEKPSKFGERIRRSVTLLDTKLAVIQIRIADHEKKHQPYEIAASLSIEIDKYRDRGEEPTSKNIYPDYDMELSEDSSYKMDIEDEDSIGSLDIEYWISELEYSEIIDNQDYEDEDEEIMEKIKELKHIQLFETYSNSDGSDDDEDVIYKKGKKLIKKQKKYNKSNTDELSPYFKLKSELKSKNKKAPTLKKGDKNEYVGLVQVMLKMKNINPNIKYSNMFDSDMVNDVKKLQHILGLKPSGVVDNNTWDRMMGSDVLVNESIYEREVVFQHKHRKNVKIVLKLQGQGSRIKKIENETNYRFPFQIGQPFNMNFETWACNNNFTLDGRNTCPKPKIFGVNVDDVPQGHEWRHIFPHKFKN